MLGQGLSEALSSDAVVRVAVQDPEDSAVDLHHCHIQGCPTKLVDQDMATNRVHSVHVKGQEGQRLQFNCVCPPLDSAITSAFLPKTQIKVPLDSSSADSWKDLDLLTPFLREHSPRPGKNSWKCEKSDLLYEEDFLSSTGGNTQSFFHLCCQVEKPSGLH